MLLGDYLHNIHNNYKKLFFSGISFNSNKIVKDNIFFAIKGNKIDGTNFISHAIKRGAKIIITEHENEGLKNKAKKSGMPYSILKKVYDRGMAAWKTGHRPGTTPQQWGYARVNAFIVKKKKGGLNHDKDLA